MIATTLPVVLPLVTAAGFDKVWFGIFIVIVVEMAQITPPVAFNLSVIQAMTGHSTSYLTWVTLPYLLIMAGFVVLLVVFPGHRLVPAEPAAGAEAARRSRRDHRFADGLLVRSSTAMPCVGRLRLRHAGCRSVSSTADRPSSQFSRIDARENS